MLGRFVARGRDDMKKAFACGLVAQLLFFLALGCKTNNISEANTTGGDSGMTGGCKGSDCPGGQVCSLADGNAQTFSCQPSNASGNALGANCSTKADCHSNACFVSTGTTGTCTARCSTDADCGDGHCARTDISDNWTAPICLASCNRDADCPRNWACWLKPNATNEAWTQACFPPQDGGKPFGQMLTSQNDYCYTPLNTQAAGSTYCSALCMADSDCSSSSVLPHCTSQAINNPNGQGTTNAFICTQ
jgi:hypothetical protein